MNMPGLYVIEVTTVLRETYTLALPPKSYDEASIFIDAIFAEIARLGSYFERGRRAVVESARLIPVTR